VLPEAKRDGKGRGKRLPQAQSGNTPARGTLVSISLQAVDCFETAQSKEVLEVSIYAGFRNFFCSREKKRMFQYINKNTGYDAHETMYA
jgi:hypothetical protein